MPTLLPALLLGSHVVLVAEFPKFDVAPSCKSAGAEAVDTGTRNASACERDEADARDKLQQEWSTFSAAEQGRCVGFVSTGGAPSYVELLTCLEIAKAAKQLPSADKLGDDHTLQR